MRSHLERQEFKSMDLWLIFLTGLTVGGITCLAVQGGLLASIIATHKGDEQGAFKVWAIITFLIFKLVAYTILGSLLGLFGSTLGFSNTLIIIIQFIAGIYMIAVALNLLNIHPIFRYVIIQPPRFLTKFIRQESKSSNFFAPALLGALTVFIPCGTTLAMEALAIASGSAILGGAIMFMFVLGTTPLFFGLGLLTHFGTKYSNNFVKLAAVIVIYLGLSAINGSLVLVGSPVTWQSITQNIPIEIDLSGGGNQTTDNVRLENGEQVIDLAVYPNGYYPNNLIVRSGIPVRLNLTTYGGLGCTSQFRIPDLNVEKNLPLSGQEIVEFTPEKPGKMLFTCSMGMYTGTITVI